MPVVLSFPSLMIPKYSRMMRTTSHNPAKKISRDSKKAVILFFYHTFALKTKNIYTKGHSLWNGLLYMIIR